MSLFQLICHPFIVALSNSPSFPHLNQAIFSAVKTTTSIFMFIESLMQFAAAIVCRLFSVVISVFYFFSYNFHYFFPKKSRVFLGKTL